MIESSILNPLMLMGGLAFQDLVIQSKTIQGLVRAGNAGLPFLEYKPMFC